MPENLLRDLASVGRPPREAIPITSCVRFPSTDIAQGRLKTRIAKGLALTFPRSDPNGTHVRRRAALVAQVLFENQPEIVGDGHAVLITRTLQPHGDESPFAIDILQFHAQDPMSASNRA